MNYGKLLYQYQNGNVQTTIYEDGTKINEWPDEEEPRFEYPGSCDVKITNYCDMDSVCVYCHEMSNKQGQHGDLELIKKVWSNQLPGTEMAIGGGNPLAHPDLPNFLTHLTGQGVIPNMTVNMLHMKRFVDMIRGFQNDKLMYGLGISYRGKKSMNLLPENIDYKNVVFHMIMGIHDLEDIKTVVGWCKQRNYTPKILLLGYKTVGHGKEYYGEDVQRNIDAWESNWIRRVMRFRGIVLSFDNLALSQLKMRNKISQDTWNEFYMGDDGTSTNYVCAVTKTFAKSSTSSIRYPLTEDCRVDGIMKVIQNDG